MTLLQTVGEVLRNWTDSVAASCVAGFDRVASPKMIRLIEEDDGAFLLQSQDKPMQVPRRVTFADGVFSEPDLASLCKGNRVEIVLQSKRFVFRPLELPSRAADFLDGIVRAQIDRLTPWSASEAVFGCSGVTKTDAGGMSTIVVATTRKIAMSYVDAVSGFHPSAVAIFTDVVGGRAERVKVFAQKARGHLDPVRLGGVLRIALGSAAAVALVSVVAAVYVADRLGTQEDELARQVSQRRAAIRASTNGDGGTPVALLERRKSENPASVIALEALSQVLPDHTYVTELHMLGNKLQIVGITRDAPSLIPLIEQSRHFTRATFYAPTTRSSSDPGERFHIEARIEPKNVMIQ